MDYFKILGVDRLASTEDIKKAFKKAALEHHPDRGGDAAKFKELTDAYSVLSDEEKRMEYSLMNGYGLSDDLIKNVDDMFNRTFNTDVNSGRDVTTTLSVSLADVYTGCKKNVKFVDKSVKTKCTECRGNGCEHGTKPKQCPSCMGRGRVVSVTGKTISTKDCKACAGRGKVPSVKCSVCNGTGNHFFSKEVSVKIPKHVSDGQKLKLSGMGCDGSPPGDLYIVLFIKETYGPFTRFGDDIMVTVDVPLKTALQGGNVVIKILDSVTHSITLQKCTQQGHIVKCDNLGFNGGSLYVTVNVLIPSLSDDAINEISSHL